MHDGRLARFTELEAAAKYVCDDVRPAFGIADTVILACRRSRKGMWSQHASEFESPATYKRRVAKQ